jgi:hypothetical protein
MELSDASQYVDVTIVSFLRNEGTLALFSGMVEDEQEVTVSLHPGYTEDVMALLMQGEQVELQVPEYLIVPWAS